MVIATRVLAALSLFLFVGFWYGDATWLMAAPPIVVGCCFSLLFVMLVVELPRHIDSKRWLAWVVATAVLSGVIGGLSLAIVSRWDLDVSRMMVVFETALLLALLVVNRPSTNAIFAATLNALVFVVTLYPTTADGSLRDLARFDRVEDEDEGGQYIFSSREDMEVVDHEVFRVEQQAWGGGLAQIDERRILLVSGEGQLLILTPGATTLDAQDTRLRFPLKRKEYSAGVTQPDRWFRVTGVLLESKASGPRKLYVAHHDWDVEGKCLTLALSETEVDFDNLVSELTWTRRFNTTPCISGESLVNETGGRLAFIDDDQILMTIGVHVTDGSSEVARPPDWLYGTTVAIRRGDWSSRIFTTGHRNPQGLLVENGRIWSTEHGPQGGDELNVLVEGSNYGWPNGTYGTRYGGKDWRGIVDGDPHPAGTKPVWAWVPSIGVSNLIRLRGTAFPAWKSDLIVASLQGLNNGYSMFRVKLDGERVVSIERIFTHRPIRDLLEHSDGRLVLWDGVTTVQVVSPATHVFSPCSGCHTVSPNIHGIGPDLYGVVGERVAHYRSYRYSDGLRSLGGRWTAARLDEFLKNPAAFAPGTTMAFPGIEDAQQRARIIRYLDEVDDAE